MTERVALVTGAGAGVGRAVALRLARDGRAGTVVVNDLDETRAKAVAEEVSALGATGLAVPADVTDWQAVGEMVGRIQSAVGDVAILVNNAGVPADIALVPGRPFAESEPAEWAPWLRLNLDAVLMCTRAVLPAMLAANWGRIVTVVSDAARVGEAGMIAYSTGKAGAAGFMRAIAREVGRANVTCNSVALGTIKHGRLAEFLTDDREQRMLKRYVMPRLGTPEDGAGAISFLCSDDAAWITGQTYPVNGGYSMAQ
ncbi:MAG TPA: SDR family oxidoreductase [Mycobacteriales bacterium]|nr:SDR family oxidoreductase [Mycobacteriales bacterium]